MNTKTRNVVRSIAQEKVYGETLLETERFKEIGSYMYTRLNQILRTNTNKSDRKIFKICCEKKCKVFVEIVHTTYSKEIKFFKIDDNQDMLKFLTEFCKKYGLSFEEKKSYNLKKVFVISI